MSEFDWNDLGNSIRDLVQDAIETRDFDKLNSNISRTIEQAMDGVGESVQKAGQAAGRAMDEAARNLRQQMGETKQTYRNGFDTHGSSGYTGFAESSAGHGWSQGQAQARRSSHRHNPGQPRKSSDRLGGKEKQWPALFADVSGRRVGGILLTVFGSIFLGAILLSLIAMLLMALVNLWSAMRTILGVAILGIPLAAAVFMLVKGGSMRAEIRRFQQYVEVLGGRSFCDLKELGDRMGRDMKYIRRDVQHMLKKQWFLQGHLDRQETCLIVTNETYSQYLQAETQREQRLREEQKRAQERGDIPEQVQEALEAGEAYIKRIRKCNDDIPGEEISAKISRIEELVQQIFVQVKENPENVSDIRKLMEYYLPTTVKLLDAYAQLDAQPVQGEHIGRSKKEIEDVLDTLNVAFEKLLDSLFRDKAWDVSSDISVLQTMLAQEGLTNNDFRRDSQ
ncbi:MAG: hypothetical protein HFI31_04485 [Lachnospiraceae bacterium]|jgi:5-bromo-4-chloroindolyl phosphate hydrolysis protein|nr:hypothetical protein [Lachnospiraceae bacterium]MCI8994947.1 hypothetical protein [Lachnospiraceae bacterium]MCI9133433.1 hypothetical protein [Lachnospiraceae bacterium]